MRQVVTRPGLVVAIVLLCVLFAVAFGSGPRGTGVSLPTVEPTALEASEDTAATPAPAPSTAPTSAPTTGQPPAAFGYVLGALLVLAVLSVLWWLVRLLLARRGRGRPRLRHSISELEPESATHHEEAVREEMRSAVAEGLREADDGDPRSAVIGCWVRLERTAESAGTRRRPGDTSADLVARLLDGHQVSAEALESLAGLYRRARFAPDEVAEAMRDDAREALSQLASELAGVGS